MKNLPVVKFLLWVLNSRKAQVAIVGVIATLCIKYFGFDEAQAANTSELIFWATLSLIGGITGEDMAGKLGKGGKDEKVSSSDATES